jgi:hypothetical protein
MLRPLLIGIRGIAVEHPASAHSGRARGLLTRWRQSQFLSVHAGGYRGCQWRERNGNLLPVSTSVADPVGKEWEVRGLRHLEDVLQSECFKRAATLRGLLLYLWENRDKDVSEYAIAVDALGRNRDFESRIDASVRVQISRLRQFLTKYYESEGRRAAIRLVIPMGTHQIKLIEARQDQSGDDGIHGLGIAALPSVASVPALQAPSRAHRLLVPVLSGVVVVLLLCVGGLVWAGLHRNNKESVASAREVPIFWKMFMDNGKPTRIVLPTPTFFYWGPPSHENSLLVRDITVNDFAKPENSAEIIDLEKKLGKPELWQNYTVASDTFASLRLARFLDSYGVRTDFSSANESPHGIIDHENIITFGTASSLAEYQSYLDQLSFKMALHERYIIDKHQPAESAHQFPELKESASRQVLPGIIALLPRGTSGSRILILQGIQTNAIISFLTSEAGMGEITKAQAEQGNSPFFEAVVLSEVNAGNPIQSRLVAFRRFTGPSSSHGQIAEAALSGSPRP